MARCGMDVRFADDELDRLETDEDFNAGFEVAIVRKFRKTMQLIRAAPDERTFYELKSLHYEKLKGKRSHQRSMRLNRQWRLILEIEQQEDDKLVVIVSIEDYH
jgi:proteic killer suppression protein